MVRKQRLPPEERGGLIAWEHENKIAYEFRGNPRRFEVYEKLPRRKLIYHFDDTYGIYFKCSSCRRPHALLWRDYFAYFQNPQTDAERPPYYKVLCVDGGPLLRLARSDEQIEGMQVTCVYRIEGDITSHAF